MGRVFQAKGTSSKVLTGNVLGLVRSSKADVAGVQRACGSAAGSEDGKKARRPYGPLGQDKDTGFYSMCDRKAWKSLEQGINMTCFMF